MRSLWHHHCALCHLAVNYHPVVLSPKLSYVYKPYHLWPLCPINPELYHSNDLPLKSLLGAIISVILWASCGLRVAELTGNSTILWLTQVCNIQYHNWASIWGHLSMFLQQGKLRQPTLCLVDYKRKLKQSKLNAAVTKKASTRPRRESSFEDQLQLLHPLSLSMWLVGLSNDIECQGICGSNPYQGPPLRFMALWSTIANS